MEEEPRRLSRANKGTHTGRAEQDVYYVPGEEPALKKAKIQESASTTDGENEGKVRCDGCGTNEENYDEETDQGGTMIECEKCRTWQHARCMGYRTQKQIPDVYLCSNCDASKTDVWKIPEGTVSAASSTGTSVTSNFKKVAVKPEKSAKQNVLQKAGLPLKLAQEGKTRANVAKALQNVIMRADSSVDAADWALKLENAVYAWAGATDRKYIEKSRSVMALVKKPAVLARLVAHDVAPADVVGLPVEEIDPDLKNYAEKVRQELMRQVVLTVNDDQSQRIRRTHKGEEIVETNKAGPDDDIGLGLVARNVDHRKFQEDKPKIVAQKHAPALYQLDDDDLHHGDEDVVQEEAEKEAASDSVSDDELDFILKPKAEETPEKAEKVEKAENLKKPVTVSERRVAIPPTMPTQFWAGEITFPDVATFGVLAEFVSCTNYEKPKDNTTASFHNRAMRVCKELLQKDKYQIEGRLDRSRADPYLAQIVRSRDLYLVRLKKEDPSYSIVYDHLLTRAKVGVLSGRAPMVKDAYLLALNHDKPSYLDFAPVGEGLYVLFSVKKDYIPAAKSILKKLEPKPVSAPVANLDSILLKLEGSVGSLGPANLPQKPAQVAALHQQIQQPSAQLSHDQMNYLSTIVQQNPHVQSDPQALLNLLQQMQT